jgi:flagellar protein FliJ
MKKFQFRLQKLLDIREKKELDIKNELAAVISRQNLEKMKQEQLKSNIIKQEKIIHTKLRAGGYTAFEALTFERFLDISHKAIELAGKKILGMEPEIREVRGRLIEASREKKVVEKLKERKLEDYNYHLNWEIAKENDDINQKIYINKQIAEREESYNSNNE